MVIWSIFGAAVLIGVWTILFGFRSSATQADREDALDWIGCFVVLFLIVAIPSCLVLVGVWLFG